MTIPFELKPKDRTMPSDSDSKNSEVQDIENVDDNDDEDDIIAGEHGTGSEIFKKCADTSFGRRLRSLSARQSQRVSEQGTGGRSWSSPYSVGDVVSPRLKIGGAVSAATSESGSASWTFQIKSTLYPEALFQLRLDVLRDNGSIRLRFDEVDSPTGNRRYDQISTVTLVAEPKVSSLSDNDSDSESPGSDSKVTYTHDEGKRITTIKLWQGQVIILQHEPLLLTVKRSDGSEAANFNERGLFHLEHYRKEAEYVQPEENKWFEGEIDGTVWEEEFREHKHVYSKGPEGYSFDITFPDSRHVYGLAEHAAPLSLPSTDGSFFTDPYRIYNIDYNNYSASSPAGIYGNVPFLQSHSPKGSVGVLTMMGSEGYIDVTHPSSSSKVETGVQTHWFSESGIVDIFILLGPTPDDLFSQYASLTGLIPLPPLFSMGHHQCRWNYDSQEDVLGVTAGFDRAGIPLDVVWLDIEWTGKGHRYFDWDFKNFPEPKEMLRLLDGQGRKLVAIVDPHLAASEDYSVMTAAQKLDVLIKTPSGDATYVGHCWPGPSGWVDYTHPAAKEWWQSLFGYEHFKESSHNLWLWNDMNEPAVFTGPEKTMPKECLHYDNVEHRDVHNVYGMLMQKETFKGLAKRDEPAKRPFVLSRSFFAGSQRYGAIWTGDNMGTWDHLAGQTAMLLNCCVSGINFVGADVGGFFGDPEHEMLVRWYQAGSFMPFFRAHANKGTKRREPYLFPPDIQSKIKDAIRLRYRLLPLWYTAFQQCSVTGMPLMRPQYVEYPKDEDGYGIDTQYHVGKSGLLFSPVVTEGAVTAEVYLASGQVHYDFYTGKTYRSSPSSISSSASSPGKGRYVKIPTPLEHSAVLIRGGSVIPTHDQGDQRSTQNALKLDLTLLIALDEKGEAQGEIYLDDGESMAYQRGEYVKRRFEFSSGRLSSVDISSGGEGGGGGGDVEGGRQSGVDALVTKVVLWSVDPSGKEKKEVIKTGLRLSIGVDWSVEIST